MASEAGFRSIEDHMLGYTQMFRLMQEHGAQAELLEEQRRQLADMEQETQIFLPAVYLRECYALSEAEYWLVMFAFCCEMEEGLCLDYRERYRRDWPSLQYAMHLLSLVLEIDFMDTAALCRKGSALEDILDHFTLFASYGKDAGWEGKAVLAQPMLLNRTAFYFLLTAGVPQGEGYTFFQAAQQDFLPLHVHEYGKLCGYLGAGQPSGVLLYGSKGSGRHTLVRRACQTLRKHAVFIRAELLLQDLGRTQARLRQTLRMVIRLMNPIVALEFCEELQTLSITQEAWMYQMERLLYEDFAGSHVCFLVQSQSINNLAGHLADVRLDLPETLTSEEQRLVLDAWVPKADRRQWQEELLARYRFHIGELERRHRTILTQAQAGNGSLANQEIWLSGLQEKQEISGLGRLVQDRDGSCGTGDMVLPPECEKQLETVVRIAKAWRERTGLQLLFYGSSGTGKTMAASVLAKRLQLPLFKVDLSQVFDKYIGETEKHIDEIFRMARRNRYLLFFDEADALFGRRTAVRDSHDKYANVSASYLLQRMEEYDGILVLATNFKDHLDDAFVRRIRFSIKFHSLDKEGRKRLWQKELEHGLPAADDVDYGSLAAAAELSPARICCAAQVAKLLAASEGSSAVTKAHLREALELEAGKDETAVYEF